MLKGSKHTEEYKKMMSKLMEGRKLSEETKRKIGEAQKGKKLSEEHKRKISIGCKRKNKGRVFSEEHKRKLSKARRGRIISNKTREKLSRIKKGHLVSSETRRKISKTLKGYVFSAERKRNISKANKGNTKLIKFHKGLKFSEEHKNNLSNSLKKYWAKFNKEGRRAISESWIIAGQIASQKANPSSIEKMICKVLDNLKIGYITQYRIKNWLVDIYIPSKNLVIECNGTYWHSLPDRIRRDKKLENYIKRTNYKLVWLWEDEIHKNPERALLENVGKVIDIASAF